MIAFLHAHLLLILLAASGVLVSGAAGFVVHHVLAKPRVVHARHRAHVSPKKRQRRGRVHGRGGARGR